MSAINNPTQAIAVIDQALLEMTARFGAPCYSSIDERETASRNDMKQLLNLFKRSTEELQLLSDSSEESLSDDEVEIAGDLLNQQGYISFLINELLRPHSDRVVFYAPISL